MAAPIGLAITMMILSFISMTAIAIVVCIYIAFEQLRTSDFKALLHIIGFDFVYSLIFFCISAGYLINYDSTESLGPVLCQLEAFVSQLSCLASTFWTSIVAFRMFSEVVLYRQPNWPAEYFWGYVFPFVWALIPLVLGLYGPNGFMVQSNCYFKDDIPKWEALLFYAFPFFGCFLFNTTLISIVFVKLKQRNDLLLTSKLLLQLFVYPSILFICWVMPITIVESQHTLWTTGFVYYFYSMTCLLGFLDTLAYFWITLKVHIRVQGCKIVYISLHESCDEQLTYQLREVE